MQKNAEGKSERSIRKSKGSRPPRGCTDSEWIAEYLSSGPPPEELENAGYAIERVADLLDDSAGRMTPELRTIVDDILTCGHSGFDAGRLSVTYARVLRGTNDKDNTLRLCAALEQLGKLMAGNPDPHPAPANHLRLVGRRIRASIAGSKDSASRSKRPRMKREAALPLIADHLKRRPHDTVKEVADKVGCSQGVVAESKPWKLNRMRLKLARLYRVDPMAFPLNERILSVAGSNSTRQMREAKYQAELLDEQLDEKERQLHQRIGEYMGQNPRATKNEVAIAVGCHVSDVIEREKMLSRLVAEQNIEQAEDAGYSESEAIAGQPQEWVQKKV